MKQLTLTRMRGDCSDTPMPIWKDLIASLVLSGWEIYGDEEKIVFTLGDEDEVSEIK